MSIIKQHSVQCRGCLYEDESEGFCDKLDINQHESGWMLCSSEDIIFVETHVANIPKRKDIVELLHYQLDNNEPVVMEAGLWHYGRPELRELLDCIYGGPPKNKEEEL